MSIKIVFLTEKRVKTQCYFQSAKLNFFLYKYSEKLLNRSEKLKFIFFYTTNF